MGLPPIGTIVIISFPFADFSGHKKRPALVVSHAEFDNLIVCQITTKQATSKRAIKLGVLDFLSGGLRTTSYIRPNKLFTLEPSMVLSRAGSVSSPKLAEVKKALKILFT